MSARANWRAHAACRDADPELFFPIGTSGPGLRQIEEAKRLCRTCPVQHECLAWALDQEVTDGVWGGTTADQRRAIRSLAGNGSRPPGGLARDFGTADGHRFMLAQPG
jgi:WhiB family transcriptional regulator, redox-sensing transcriptional regulator